MSASSNYRYQRCFVLCKWERRACFFNAPLVSELWCGTVLIAPSTASWCSTATSWQAQPIYLLSASSGRTCQFLSVRVLKISLGRHQIFFCLCPLGMDPTLCKHEVWTLLPPPQRVRRAGGNTDWSHGGLCGVQVAQVWAKAVWTHGLWPCQIIVLFSKQKNAYKLEAQTCSRGFLTDPHCTLLHQHPMSFLGTRQASQTLVSSRCRGLRPLLLCFWFLGKCHQPCRNGGKCTGKNKCKCSKGYQGDLCSKRKYQSHSISPCCRSIKLAVQYLFTQCQH